LQKNKFCAEARTEGRHHGVVAGFEWALLQPLLQNKKNGGAAEITDAGKKEVEAAKADGRWDAAYASPRDAYPPEDFLQELNKNKKAKDFFETLNRANVYAIVYRLQTAKKPETRARRMKLILAMMDQGQTFHPSRKIADL